MVRRVLGLGAHNGRTFAPASGDGVDISVGPVNLVNVGTTPQRVGVAARLSVLVRGSLTFTGSLLTWRVRGMAGDGRVLETGAQL